MFSHLKSKQKSMAGFVNPGFHNLVKLSKDEKSIEIFGEKHSDKMIKRNIYTKIVKELKNNPEYKTPLILVEHSDHPELCSLKPEDIDKFKNIIEYSGSELIFFELINHPVISKHLKCVDNRIIMGYLPAFKEMQYSNMIQQFLEIEDEKLPLILEQILEPLKEIVFTYQNQIQILKENSDYYKDTILEKLHEHYILILETHFTIILNILTKTKLLHTDLSELLNIPTISNFTLLMRIFSVIIENFIKISSLSVDVNIFNIISQDDSHDSVLLFCGNNHCIRLTKLFFKDYMKQIYDKNSQAIENFSLEDVEKADIKPVFSQEKDILLLKYLESLSSNNISEKNEHSKKNELNV